MCCSAAEETPARDLSGSAIFGQANDHAASPQDRISDATTKLGVAGGGPLASTAGLDPAQSVMPCRGAPAIAPGPRRRSRPGPGHGLVDHRTAARRRDGLASGASGLQPSLPRTRGLR